MGTYLGETAAVAKVAWTGPREWMRHVIALLDSAACQLNRHQPVHDTILEAAALLRKQIDPEGAEAPPDRKGGLRVWQARKVRAYIDSHIEGPVLVADLCALVRLSEAHFSRAFGRTFGKSPHAFVIGRRVELAAQYMLQTQAPLSDIALRCGFTDQPHLCKLFRQTTGQTPAAWRRAHSSEDDGDRHSGPPKFPQDHMKTYRHSAGGVLAQQALSPGVA
jgi:AraC family transcriptional regulator